MQVQQLRTELDEATESSRRTEYQQQHEVEQLQRHHRRQSVVWSEEKRVMKNFGAVKSELLKSSHKKQVSWA